MGNFLDLTGQVFGRCTVLKLDIEKTKEKGRTYWICQCECGNIKSIPAYNLISGKTHSCGCMKNEMTSKRLSKRNRIEFDSNFGCLKVYFNNSIEYFLCDIEDRDIIESHTWFKVKGYVSTNFVDKQCKRYNIKLHRLIMAKYYDIDILDIDHINHNKLDNRKYNLRVCSRGQNLKNRKYYSNTKELFIYYDKNRNNYQVNITNGPRARFKDKNDAINFRDNYLKDHSDDFIYNPAEDYNNRNKSNIIYPFKFINPENIIKPFRQL